MHVCSIRRIPEDKLQRKIQDHQDQIHTKDDIADDRKRFEFSFRIDVGHQVNGKDPGGHDAHDGIHGPKNGAYEKRSAKLRVSERVGQDTDDQRQKHIDFKGAEEFIGTEIRAVWIIRRDQIQNQQVSKGCYFEKCF